jgi:uncharacterized membrane protein
VIAPVLGGFFGLLAAATFAFNNAAARRGVLTGSVAQAIAITVPIGVPIFLFVALLTGSLAFLGRFSSSALIYLAAAGVVHFVFGRYCNFRATKAMGANLVGPVQQVSLVLTLGLAIWILGETLTLLRIVGIALVALGPMLTLPGNKRADKSATAPEPVAVDAPAAAATVDVIPPFRANYTEGYIWALLSAVGYGLSPILITLGLEHKGLGASLAGGLVSYSAATVVAAIILLWPGQLRHVLAMRPQSAKWFTISGVLVCVSQMFLYMAYAIAPVSVVTPIQRLSIVFRIYAGWLINREHEVFGGPVIAGTVLSLIGAVALTLSTDVVLSYLPHSDALVSLAHWHWP